MLGRALRFIHSADWHLEQMPSGLSEIPDTLRDLLIDCAYNAAAGVVETALTEQVDFIVLAGGIIRPREAGARGLLFLQEQFQRLADRNITVYWSGGDVDRIEELAEFLALPDNVRLFPSGRVGECVHKRDGQPVARILGASREPRTHLSPTEFPADSEGLFTVAVLPAAQPGESYSRPGVDYWALGGQHDLSASNGAAAAQFCGTPQGRSPEETGPHGCTVIQVDERGHVHTHQVMTDVLRFHVETLDANNALSSDEFQRRLRERTQTLQGDSSRVAHLISWRVTGSGPVIRALRHGTLINDTLRSLRDQFGRREPAAWTIDIEVETPAQFAPTLFEQDSILGSFLRSWQRQTEAGHVGAEWRRFLPEVLPTGSVLARLPLAEPADAERVGRLAVALGVDLLSGEETRT